MTRSEWLKQALLTVLLAGMFFSVGWGMDRQSRKAKTENQAVWLARAWQEGRPFADSLRVAGELGAIHLSPDEWVPGEDSDIASGPVVDGRRMCIRKDRSLYWRAIR